jgi:hypothetical protein
MMRRPQHISGCRRGRNRPPGGLARFLALALVGCLLTGCGLNATQVFIPLAYGGIGTCIALLVSPSLAAAVIGFALGAVIGAAVYNNSLKADIMERQDWHRWFPDRD